MYAQITWVVEKYVNLTMTAFLVWYCYFKWHDRLSSWGQFNMCFKGKFTRGLNDLERQKQEAEQQLSQYKQKLSQLEKEVEKIVAEYIKEGENAKAKIIEEAKASAEKLQEQAKKNIAHEFEKAKKELRAEMADQAVAMAEALIKKNINDEDQKQIINEYLKKVVVAQW